MPPVAASANRGHCCVAIGVVCAVLAVTGSAEKWTQKWTSTSPLLKGGSPEVPVEDWGFEKSP